MILSNPSKNGKIHNKQPKSQRRLAIDAICSYYA